MFFVVLLSLGRVWQICVSVRSIKTATVSPSLPTAEPASGREYLSSGSLTPPVWVSNSTLDLIRISCEFKRWRGSDRLNNRWMVWTPCNILYINGPLGCYWGLPLTSNLKKNSNSAFLNYSPKQPPNSSKPKQWVTINTFFVSKFFRGAYFCQLNGGNAFILPISVGSTNVYEFLML